MPLSMVEPNKEVRLVSIRGGGRMKRRLADLGLNIGMTMKVVRQNGQGPMIIAVKESRLAIGKGMASRIIVETI